MRGRAATGFFLKKCFAPSDGLSWIRPIYVYAQGFPRLAGEGFIFLSAVCRAARRSGRGNVLAGSDKVNMAEEDLTDFRSGGRSMRKLSPTIARVCSRDGIMPGNSATR